MRSEHPADADRHVDVREIDGEPFSDIMAALAELAPDETLLLTASFEPEPLYDVLTEKGFSYETSNPEHDRWCVLIEVA